jgi:hypothetical protein
MNRPSHMCTHGCVISVNVYAHFEHYWSHLDGHIKFTTQLILMSNKFECLIGAHHCSLISRKLIIHMCCPFMRVYIEYLIPTNILILSIFFAADSLFWLHFPKWWNHALKQDGFMGSHGTRETRTSWTCCQEMCSPKSCCWRRWRLDFKSTI